MILRQGLFLKTQQIIDGVVACGKIDAVDCSTCGEQGCDGVGLAAVLPVRASACLHGELKRGAVPSVECAHGSACGNERADDGVMGAPGSYMEGGRIPGEFPVGSPSGQSADAETPR